MASRPAFQNGISGHSVRSVAELTVVMKNWEPFVFGPALAMLKRPGRSCRSLKLHHNPLSFAFCLAIAHSLFIRESFAVDAFAAPTNRLSVRSSSQADQTASRAHVPFLLVKSPPCERRLSASGRVAAYEALI